ncbi:MAG: hypothetical protein JJE22_20365 [Bacteroidia bacterium]|nr:hypothetical protein [Bacteroidia bacterium]
MADVVNDLVKACFQADMNSNVNVYRQYLQTALVKQAVSIIESKAATYDDVAKAATLNAIKKLKVQLAHAVSPNEETKAHRGNLLFIINNALEPK